MKGKDFNYYLMQDRGIVAKGIYFDNWIFDFNSRSWVKDTKCIISDALMGYDPGEPEGSPYGIGSTSEMDEIKHIDYKTAMQFISDTIVQNLINKWKGKYAQAKAKWDKKPGWPAKQVSTSFYLYGKRYVLKPEDFGWDKTSFDEGFMESIQKELEKDLMAVGATEITSSGELD